MCLSIPAKIISIDGVNAIVSVGGTEVAANLSLVEDAGIGDYVLVHTGIALQKIDEDEAIKTLAVFEEFEQLNAEMDAEETKSSGL